MPRNSPYSVHPGVDYVQSILNNMKPKTGRSMDEWVRFVKKSGPEGERERVAWLKSEHKLGTNYAKFIAAAAEGKGLEMTSPEAYLEAAGRWVEEMFAGPKAGLRPIYSKLIELGKALGSDVRVCPCKTIVPLYRQHVFAEIKPSTRTRIDLGLALKNAKQRIPKRLIDTGGLDKGNRITHRIPLTATEEIDSEVERWLGCAYELDE
jgi:hypothetical protein